MVLVVGKKILGVNIRGYPINLTGADGACNGGNGTGHIGS